MCRMRKGLEEGGIRAKLLATPQPLNLQQKGIYLSLSALEVLVLNSRERGKQPQHLLRSPPASASCTQQAGRGGTVTFQATLGHKTRDEGPSAVMLSGSITSLT